MVSLWPKPKRGKGDAASVAAAGIIDASTHMGTVNRTGQTRGKTRAWQKEAWRLYDEVGVAHFAAGFLARTLSRVRYYVADVDDGGRATTTETTNPTALAVGRWLFDGPSGLSEAAEQAGLNWWVAGECYAVAEAATGAWYIASTQQIRLRADGTVVIDKGHGEQHVLSPKDLFARWHVPHPARISDPDSPTRAALGDLRELQALAKHLAAEIDSRLIGNGILLFAQEVVNAIAAQPGMPGTGEPGKELRKGNPVFDEIKRAFLTSIRDQASVSALVPTMLTTPADLIDKAIRHIKVENALSDVQIALKQEALRQYAVAVDLPQDMILGRENLNHWNAWISEKENVNIYTVPPARRFSRLVTDTMFRPGLAAAGLDAAKFTIWYDTTELTSRADRSADANNAWDRRVISNETYRAMLGFEEDDAPAAAELIQRLLRDLLLAAPQYAPSILPLLGSGAAGNTAAAPPLKTPADTTPQIQATPTASEGAEPAEAAGPAEPAPDVTRMAATPGIPELSRTALVTCANTLVEVALERAGKRLRTRDRYALLRDTPPALAHTVIAVDEKTAIKALDGLWAAAASTADVFGLDKGDFTRRLATYTAQLMTSGVAHDIRYLPAVIDDACA